VSENLPIQKAAKDYYRLEGAKNQAHFDLEVIGNFHIHHHAGIECDCVELVKAIQQSTILEFMRVMK